MPRCPLPEGATRYRPPRPEAGAYLPGIPLPAETTALAVRQSFELQVEHDIVDARAHFALYKPSKELCREAARGAEFKRGGFELVRFWLPSAGSQPCLLYLWCQVLYTVYGERLVLAPSGLSLETKRHFWLDAEIRDQLGSADVTTLMMRTGLPRRQINAIAAAMVEEKRQKRPSSGHRPLGLGADFVAGGRSRSDKYAVLTLTASDPRLGENIPLNFLRMPPGEGRTGPRSKIVQAAKKEFLSIDATDLLVIALDGEGKLEKLLREALRLAIRQNVALKKVKLVLDRHHVQTNALKPLEAARNKIVAELSKDDPEQKKLLDLLAEARYDLEEAPAFAVEEDPQRRRRLARVFKNFEQLKPLYEAFTGLRRIYDCPGRDSAEIAYRAWWKGLARGVKQRYRNFRSYIKKREEMFFAYFEVKEETFRLYGMAYSLTSGFTEAMNDEFKSRRKLARASSLEILGARVLSRFDERKVRRRAALKRRRAAKRAEKEAQIKSQSRVAAKSAVAADLAAEADLDSEAEFLKSLFCPRPRAPDAAAPPTG
jgi:hypothetical protein